MKYFLIAGEASGDMHGAKLMTELKKFDVKADFMYFGGDLMKKQGGELLKHYREMAYMGILPVLTHLGAIKRNLALCKKQLLMFNPDVVILIDYPGFNLQIAKFAKKKKYATAYYISPKIWAWKTRRIKSIKRYIDQMYTIFPFETAFYQQYNYQANYVGNPVYDIIQKEKEKKVDSQQFCKKNNLSGKPIVALLAGSRKHEVEEMLPIMAKVSDNFPDYEFVIAGVDALGTNFYKPTLTKNLQVVYNQTYDLLQNCKAALVTSGTATLETGLLYVPQVVCYRMGFGWFLEKIKDKVLKTKYFSLINIIAEKEVVKELFQSQVSVHNLSTELDQLLHNAEYQQNMLNNYRNIETKIKTNGAAKAAAKLIVESIKK